MYQWTIASEVNSSLVVSVQINYNIKSTYHDRVLVKVTLHVTSPSPYALRVPLYYSERESDFFL